MCASTYTLLDIDTLWISHLKISVPSEFVSEILKFMFALNILIFIYLLYFLVGNILKDTHSWEGLENSPETKFQMKVHLFQLIYPFHNWLSVAVLAYFLAVPLSYSNRNNRRKS